MKQSPTAYEMGKQAYRNGAEPRTCPFPTAYDEREWFLGWWDGWFENWQESRVPSVLTLSVWGW